MPWRTQDVMNLRMEFIVRAREGAQSFRSLCLEYGISPKTGYKWINRSKEAPLLGLLDHTRRPLRCSLAVDTEVALKLVHLKLAHPLWGPKKIRVLYERTQAKAPSLSTVRRVLDRVGMVNHRRVRAARQDGRLVTSCACKEPNDVWTVDFKGWWRTQERARCEPLTVRDAYSRYVLAAVPLLCSDTGHVRAQFEKLFDQFGLPKVIHSDNGVPFASMNGLLGLTRLSAWWIALGMMVDRGRPGHPQDNGAHERMHLDLTIAVQNVVRGTLDEQAQALELWRQEYNDLRPHEAIDNQTPSTVYSKSVRKYQGTPDELIYEPSWLSRKVNEVGLIHLADCSFYLSSALRGWNVGLRPRENRIYEVYFAQLYLGYIDLETLSFRGAASRSPEARLPLNNQ